MKLLTQRQFEIELSRARNEVYDEIHRAKRMDDIEHRMWELENRIATLENGGMLPSLKACSTQRSE